MGQEEHEEKVKVRHKTGFARSSLRVILRKLRQDEPKQKPKNKNGQHFVLFLTGEPATKDHRTNRTGPNSRAETISEQNLRKEEPKKGEGREDSTQKTCKKEKQPKGPPYVAPKT